MDPSGQSISNGKPSHRVQAAWAFAQSHMIRMSESNKWGGDAPSRGHNFQQRFMPCMGSATYLNHDVFKYCGHYVIEYLNETDIYRWKFWTWLRPAFGYSMDGGCQNNALLINTGWPKRRSANHCHNFSHHHTLLGGHKDHSLTVLKSIAALLPAIKTHNSACNTCVTYELDWANQVMACDGGGVDAKYEFR